MLGQLVYIKWTWVCLPLFDALHRLEGVGQGDRESGAAARAKSKKGRGQERQDHFTMSLEKNIGKVGLKGKLIFLRQSEIHNEVC